LSEVQTDLKGRGQGQGRTNNFEPRTNNA